LVAWTVSSATSKKTENTAATRREELEDFPVIGNGERFGRYEKVAGLLDGGCPNSQGRGGAGIHQSYPFS
jgi:hypothetical protein